MQNEVMFAGFGGQGILLSGKILTHAAMEAGREVLWIPSYGPEMRGGTAYCMVIVSERAIGSPIVKNPKHLVAMNRPSLEKFAPMVKPGGVILVNASLIPIDVDVHRDDADILRIPVTDIANDLGNVKAANIVALGAFISRSGLVEDARIDEAVREEFESREALLQLNLNALRKGREAAAG